MGDNPLFILGILPVEFSMVFFYSFSKQVRRIKVSTYGSR